MASSRPGLRLQCTVWLQVRAHQLPQRHRLVHRKRLSKVVSDQVVFAHAARCSPAFSAIDVEVLGCLDAVVKKRRGKLVAGSRQRNCSGSGAAGMQLRKRARFSSKSVDTIAGLNARDGDGAAAGVQQLASEGVGGVVALHDGLWRLLVELGLEPKRREEGEESWRKGGG